MNEIFLAPETITFTIALSVIAILALIEVCGMLIGFSMLGLGDGLDFEAPEIEGNMFAGLMSWLKIDKVPLMVWLTVFLCAYGVTGLLLSQVYSNVTSTPAPQIISIPVALVLGLILTSITVRKIHKLIPSISTSATTHEKMEGEVAYITQGTATLNNPTEAKFHDSYSQVHYVMVEPMDGSETFTTGDKVVLVERNGSFWKAFKYHD
jgi:hypothetical protein